jgi:fumarate reductase subunit C
MNTYRRPMAGWWQRNAFYRWYMLREASCVFITAYALVLLLGLYRLAQGPQAFESWVAALRTPGSLVFHLVAFCLVAYHSWTWFKIMPKTMPRLPLPDALIVIGGVAAVLAASAAIVWLALA